jgi:Arc/MetJ-type ribon-helix-helix transcriptional regulator
MPSTRTQIYLTREQRARLDELVRRRGGTLAEVIRDAVDAYLDDAAPDANHALERTFGALPQLETPPRDQWAARERRIRRG